LQCRLTTVFQQFSHLLLLSVSGSFRQSEKCVNVYLARGGRLPFMRSQSCIRFVFPPLASVPHFLWRSSLHIVCHKATRLFPIASSNAEMPEPRASKTFVAYVIFSSENLLKPGVSALFEYWALSQAGLTPNQKFEFVICTITLCTTTQCVADTPPRKKDGGNRELFFFVFC